ncbi:TPA: hypothetical protein JRX32_001382 [Elizabethkingia anophelis]|nr:hypothetical protein [Elizabethkingia anophelis]HAY3546892.1 hypothetical protein [Elizabethkingia anophelis]
MKQKYYDLILQIFLVVIACVVVGFVSRYYYLRESDDEFGGTIIFWGATAFAFVIYVLIVIILDEFLRRIPIVEYFRKKLMKDEASEQIEISIPTPADSKEISDSSENLKKESDLMEVGQNFEKENRDSEREKPTEKNPIQQPAGEELAIKTDVINEAESQKNENPQENIEENESDSDGLSEIEKIRIRAKLKEEEILKEKIDFIVKYTQEKFAPYTSDKDVNRLCDSLVGFLSEGKIDGKDAVKINTLKTIDLMHFGWNSWNYYRGNNQRKDVARFLKTVFAQSFREMEESTIEKLLSSRKNDGLIKIDENLLQ